MRLNDVPAQEYERRAQALQAELTQGIVILLIGYSSESESERSFRRRTWRSP